MSDDLDGQAVDERIVFDRDGNPDKYIYDQLADHLARLIAAGQLKPNSPLPAERRLAAEYGVSLGTARHATRILRDLGPVVTVRSKGTFVRGPRASAES
ncbi:MULTISPECIES: winged helix-turn-helix domain-containing protein [Amycolatopsis]|uniref:HTH gntR-type domain-containing protein n=1 Tax=Amycolatopsis tucumanensis TaxID=401106 RepID=A0ABP7JGT9_9PSEU|nr:winged helix-turn-helix domain-containing protein [Amycolatopsis tucumanensis]MCF6426057.1 winged helix-turn-helix domain-containing protein [Amycolatopsis tucumanensis]